MSQMPASPAPIADASAEVDAELFRTAMRELAVAGGSLWSHWNEEAFDNVPDAGFASTDCGRIWRSRCGVVPHGDARAGRRRRRRHGQQGRRHYRLYRHVRVVAVHPPTTARGLCRPELRFLAGNSATPLLRGEPAARRGAQSREPVRRTRRIGRSRPICRDPMDHHAHRNTGPRECSRRLRL